jgi:2-amino-4-hydroxy-6-hydroxymethyldihydropteridine diphosphokinase
MKETNVFIGLGSNLGDKKSNILSAIDKIDSHQSIEINKISNYYYSEPWGFDSTEYFLNCVVELRTILSPLELLTTFKAIEYELGRTRKFTNEYQNRTIDIDILYFNSQIFELNDLMIPHPRIKERLFVLKPLSEIAPDFKDPISLISMEELFKKCKDVSNIFTEETYLNRVN